VIELAPDRIATFSYAHVPEVRRIQQAVDASGLPDPETKLGLFLDAVEMLEDAGYVWIGFDHFARPDDELAVAAADRTLSRNFMGFTTGSAPDMVALGMSSIGYVDDCHVQNDPGLRGWENSIRERNLAVVRGHRMSRDDRLRSRIIQHMLCNLELRGSLVAGPRSAAGAECDDRTGEEIVAMEAEHLRPFEDEGFLEGDGSVWRVTSTGRFFMRSIAAAMDPYLRDASRARPVFSSSV
jgi:oxygen-independent coproporphyrinogen-3 oxidase